MEVCLFPVSSRCTFWDDSARLFTQYFFSERFFELLVKRALSLLMIAEKWLEVYSDGLPSLRIVFFLHLCTSPVFNIVPLIINSIFIAITTLSWFRTMHPKSCHVPSSLYLILSRLLVI